RSSHTAAAPLPLYTLSLHDALPICRRAELVMDDVVEFLVGEAAPTLGQEVALGVGPQQEPGLVVHLAVIGVQGHALGLVARHAQDRKSTRLNSSHVKNSYAVFCLKK